MPADWTVRRAGDGDAARLALVGAATFLDTFAGILDGDAIVAHCAHVHAAPAYRAALDSGAAAWLAEAVVGGGPIGFAMVGAPDLADARAGDIELKRIYCFARFHGRGVGAALMACAIEEARARDASRLLLGVFKQNARARAFYTKSGFAPIAERTFRVGTHDYDDWVLARPIER